MSNVVNFCVFKTQKVEPLSSCETTIRKLKLDRESHAQEIIDLRAKQQQVLDEATKLKSQMDRLDTKIKLAESRIQNINYDLDHMPPD